MMKNVIVALGLAGSPLALLWSVPASAVAMSPAGAMRVDATGRSSLPLPPVQRVSESAVPTPRGQRSVIDAPTFPPATRFEAPARQPYRLSAKASSFKILMEHPVAWAMVLKEVPVLAVFVKAPAAAPFLANFSLQNALEIGLTTQAKFDRIDQQLQSLEMVQ